MHIWSNADDKRLLGLLAKGLTIRECAERIGASYKSVEARAGRLRKHGLLEVRNSVPFDVVAAGSAASKSSKKTSKPPMIQVTSQMPKSIDDIPVYVDEDGEEVPQLQAGHEEFAALTALAKKAVRKGGLSLEELCDTLGLSPKQARELTSRAIEAGYHVDLHAGKLDFRPPSLDATEQTVQSTYVPEAGEEIVVGIVSDPHFASKHHERGAIQRHVDWLYESGVRYIFGPGDWMAGGYSFLKYEVTHAGIEDQSDQVTQFIKSCGRELNWMAIAGNHDESFNVGINGAKMIEQQLKSSGWDNFTYYGARAAILKLFNTRFAMHHPGGGLSYAVSYKIQKYVDETPPHRRAQFLFTGHTHQALYIRRAGCHSFLCGTFENSDSGFGRMLGGDVAVGSWLIKYRLDQNHNVMSVTPEFRQQAHHTMSFVQVPENLQPNSIIKGSELHGGAK